MTHHIKETRTKVKKSHHEKDSDILLAQELSLGYHGCIVLLALLRGEVIWLDEAKHKGIFSFHYLRIHFKGLSAESQGGGFFFFTYSSSIWQISIESTHSGTDFIHFRAALGNDPCHLL